MLELATSSRTVTVSIDPNGRAWLSGGARDPTRKMFLWLSARLCPGVLPALVWGAPSAGIVDVPEKLP
jgi:hypothetical protein